MADRWSHIVDRSLHLCGTFVPKTECRRAICLSKRGIPSCGIFCVRMVFASGGPNGRDGCGGYRLGSLFERTHAFACTRVVYRSFCHFRVESCPLPWPGNREYDSGCFYAPKDRDYSRNNFVRILAADAIRAVLECERSCGSGSWKNQLGIIVCLWHSDGAYPLFLWRLADGHVFGRRSA